MEIERKWLVKNLPNLKDIKGIKHERYFLLIDSNIELRVQKLGEVYEFERKIEINPLTREQQKLVITETEYKYFKSCSNISLVRDSYLIQDSPEITIKIYHNEFEGLIRVEVEFNTEEEAKSYIPPSWFGTEITQTKLGKDKNLVSLSEKEFKQLLEELS